MTFLINHPPSAWQTRELHPRGLKRRWAVYHSGELVCVKYTKSLMPRAEYGKLADMAHEIAVEFVLLTPRARWLAGDPKFRSAP